MIKTASSSRFSSSCDEDDDFDSCSESSREESSSPSSSNSTSSSSNSSTREIPSTLHQPSWNKNTISNLPFQYSFSSFVRRRKQSLHSSKCYSDQHATRINDDNDDEDERKDQSKPGSTVANEELLASPSKRNKNSQDRLSSAISLERRKRQLDWSTYLLILSVVLWSFVQINIFYSSHVSHRSNYGMQTKTYNHNAYVNIKDDPNAIGNKDMNGRSQNRPRSREFNRKPDKEALLPGCEYVEWQQEKGSSLLQCNALHELDLKFLLGRSFPSLQRQRKHQRNNSVQDAQFNRTIHASLNHTKTLYGKDTSRLRSNDGDSVSLGKYLSSGLWRDVWSLESSHDFPATPSTVLKMMKMEHDVVHRNFERHRREAATMERLADSPHVIDLYAFCGNTILTEFAPRDLSTMLQMGHSRNQLRKKSSRVNESRSSQHAGLQKSDEAIAISKSLHFSGNASHSENYHLTMSQRINMALQAAKAIQSLHENDVIHADLTAKQFLVLETEEQNIGGRSMLLKINDFNRCRFVPHKIRNSTSDNDEKCPIRIPSAPGIYRSPEEYAGQNLTNQIDMFSLGHVLFEIWTGTPAWGDVGGRQVRQHVLEGQLPPGLRKLLAAKDETQTDEIQHAQLHRLIAQLIGRCYTVNPNDRITAAELVGELNRLAEESKRNNL
ncbi:serine/threonine protein kinase [Nitzschia inconspicua]|uniref:Serine/threonine protein kinase n=1 Tax=Nitzschia inconspicua TaxID=303405 RepID=A0A9K3PB73_9STRA|nr:serine/threonine protein kinase [Nitzschia inconspicua]